MHRYRHSDDYTPFSIAVLQVLFGLLLSAIVTIYKQLRRFALYCWHLVRKPTT